MRSRSAGAVLAMGLLASACLDGSGDGPGSTTASTANGSGAFDSFAAVVRPVLGATGDFTMQVMRRGCSDNPYVGKSPIEVLGLTTAYTAVATTGYTDGIQRAQVALGLQRVQNQSLITDLDGLKGGLGGAAMFSSFRMIEANSEAADALVLDLEQRTAAAPLPESVLAELSEASRSLHVGNHFQVDAAVGAILLASYVADSMDRSGSRDLARIMLAEFNQGGGQQMVESLTSSPGTLMNMVLNLGNAYSLHRTLNDVTDFSEEDEAVRMLGIDVDIRAFEAVAQASARSLRSRYPQELDYQPTGSIVRRLMLNALERRGVNSYLAGPALTMVMAFCGGTFGDTTMVATTDPATPLEGPEIAVAQQALIDLGHLQGRADGVPGRMTAGAVMEFQRARGLPADGQLTQGLLGELRAAQGRRAELAAGTSVVPAAAQGASPRARTPTAEEACVTAEDNAFVGGFKVLAVRLQQEMNRAAGTEYEVDCP